MPYSIDILTSRLTAWRTSGVVVGIKDRLGFLDVESTGTTVCIPLDLRAVNELIAALTVVRVDLGNSAGMAAVPCDRRAA